ncbi:MAG: uroporphyrinogen-III synthase, partial [Gammaproteobacteria bacterium]|nr:uroporphyrinogen-III synthase [Gammaproteobacteria bacterium]
MGTELDGLTVLVTRPRHQAGNMARLIEERGGTALRFAALEIEARDDDSEIRQQIGDIRDYDIAIFISTNAVENGVRFVPQDAPRPQIAAIGPSTARALADAGLPCDIRAAHGFTSEALLREPVFGDLTGKRLVIFRGRGGRAILGRELQNRGADVSYAEVYTRDRPDELDDEIAVQLAAGNIDAVTATSAETLVNLYELADGPTLDGLLAAQLVTASERVAKKAAALGFTHAALVAPGPDDEALVETLSNWHGNTHPAVTERSMTNNVQPDETPTAETLPATDADADAVETADNDEPATEPATEHVAEPDTVVPTAPVRRGGTLFGLLSILLSIAALAAVAWMWWQQQQQDAVATTALATA